LVAARPATGDARHLVAEPRIAAGNLELALLLAPAALVKYLPPALITSTTPLQAQLRAVVGSN
jgi:hypothetical protein